MSPFICYIHLKYNNLSPCFITFYHCELYSMYLFYIFIITFYIYKLINIIYYCINTYGNIYYFLKTSF